MKELRIGFVVVVVVFVMQIDMKKKGSNNFTFITEDFQQVHCFPSYKLREFLVSYIWGQPKGLFA